jgi:uncharacterized protein (TIGR00369 family)
MLSNAIRPNVQRVFELDQGVAQPFGYEVVQAGEGQCVLKVVVREQFVNAAGLAHGSLAFTLMDTASAYAIASLDSMGVTINANRTYVKGVSAGDELITRASIFTRSKRILSMRSEVLVKEAVVAHGSFVFQLLEPRN